MDSLPWTHVFNRLGDLSSAEPNLRPIRGQQYDDADEPSCEILLVWQALVGRHKDIVSVVIREIEQFTVVFLGPAILG